MTEQANPDPDPTTNPAPGADRAAGGAQPGAEEPVRDFGATISALAEDISERVTVLVDKATPVVRDAAARASELVAKAGEAAGPAAHRAAVATESLGEKVAAKGREIATDLRRSNAAGPDAGDPAPAGDGAASAEAAPPAAEGDAGGPPAS